MRAVSISCSVDSFIVPPNALEMRYLVWCWKEGKGRAERGVKSLHLVDDRGFETNEIHSPQITLVETIHFLAEDLPIDVDLGGLNGGK